MHFTPSSVVLASLAVAQAARPGPQVIQAPRLEDRQNVSALPGVNMVHMPGFSVCRSLFASTPGPSSGLLCAAARLPRRVCAAPN